MQPDRSREKSPPLHRSVQTRRAHRLRLASAVYCATKQFSPAALSVWHACLASAGDAAAARSRIPPGKGTISLFIAAMDGKRADSAPHARSACAWLANAPSWITLPGAPLGFGSGAGAAFGTAGTSAAGAGLGGLATGVSGSAFRSSCEFLSPPALVSNAV